MKRSVILLTVVALMVVMVAMSASAAFAQGQRLCGTGERPMFVGTTPGPGGGVGFTCVPIGPPS